MYMRLAFAVAAHLEPEILLVDEVLAVGDAAFQKKCLGKMGDVSRDGRTVLFVSHNMAAIRKLCSRAMLLDLGRLEIKGTTDQVVAHYLFKNESETSSVIDLPPGSHDAPAAPTSLRFFSQDGTPQAKFRLGESWRILLEFEVFRPLNHVIAAVGLITMESVAIITYWSEPQDLMPGRYCAQFDCDLPLKKCNLQFAVGLSSYEKTFYYSEGIGGVSISEIAVKEQPVRSSTAGLLFEHQQCKITPIN
jgi:lipopolysaccharide transport system ATP-binding protein